MKDYLLNYDTLKKDGVAPFQTGNVHLVVSLRGNCMVDAFDSVACRHIAYIDFDLQKEVILSYAFGSPVIGLPFSTRMRREYDRLISPFNDLRSRHDVGLFVEESYRNKQVKGIWNLDEVLMAVAMETAYRYGADAFTIKPTGDRARYYRKKFGARTLPTTGTDLILAIDLKTYRKELKHIEVLEGPPDTHLFKVKGCADN